MAARTVVQRPRIEAEVRGQKQPHEYSHRHDGIPAGQTHPTYVHSPRAFVAKSSFLSGHLQLTARVVRNIRRQRQGRQRQRAAHDDSAGARICA